MKIVITGGAGFLGRYLVDVFSDHDVVVFDKIEHPSHKTHIGDVTSLLDCLEAFRGASAVIHVAAHNSPSGHAPEEVFRQNVMGTFVVHEAARALGITKVLSTSSEAAYGFFFKIREHIPEYLPLDEEHPLRPQDAYGLSKKAGEAIAQAYADAYDMDAAVIRPPWIVSPQDYSVHKGFKAGTAFPLDTFQSFAWVDVRDLARAYRIIFDKSKGYEIYTVCADDSTLNEPVTEVMKRLFPSLPPIDAQTTLSNKKIRTLGWIPEFSRSQFLQ